MSPLAAIVALPVAAGVIWWLLRTPLARVLVKAPSGERWRMDATPLLGGVGIFAGLVAGVSAALAAGASPATTQLLGILGGCALLFLAGLWDDVRHLSPRVKLLAQFGAAGIVLGTGTNVELIGNEVAATVLALLWLVGMTNAFNLLDNMDGLAATLAGIAALFFAIDAVTVHPSHLHLAFALALALACAGFLPFNLRPGRAAVFMGDSGSQVLGFALASLGLSASWTVAGTTVATLLLPVLILAVPILDTGLVTVLRLLNGRPVTQGGRDHSSHRLVRYGLSEKHAVLLLGAVAAALGATSLGYNVLDDARVTLPGVLLTFVLLVQFASFLADLERRPAAAAGGAAGFLRAFDVHWRRLIEVAADFVVVCGAFTASFLIVFGGTGTVAQRHVFTVALPLLVAARYVAFILFGLYRSIWRYAGSRDLAAIPAATVVSGAVAVAALALTQPLDGFRLSVFAVDALLCTTAVAASRFGERAVLRAFQRSAQPRRTLIAGAGRAGRALHRELQETPGERVVGYLDDNPRLRRRRIHGVAVLGTLPEAARAIERSRPDRVLVTIPDAEQASVAAVLAACADAGVSCGIVRREIDIQTPAPVGAAGE